MLSLKGKVLFLTGKVWVKREMYVLSSGNWNTATLAHEVYGVASSPGLLRCVLRLHGFWCSKTCNVL